MGSAQDISNNKYGKLTAIKPTKERYRSSIVWECKCECGRTAHVCVRLLNAGNRTTCGLCIKRSDETAYNTYFDSYKQNAKKRGLSFSLTKKQFMSLVSRDCWYCGAEPQLRSHSRNNDIIVNGIDRTNNSKGYLINNCVPCCKICNTMKKNMDEGQFREHIAKIYNTSNGDDNETRSIHLQEKNVGDRLKNVLKNVYDMVDKDNLQKAEIKALISNLVDEHIDEFDEQ